MATRVRSGTGCQKVENRRNGNNLVDSEAETATKPEKVLP
jgi:hypothetical protein